MRITRPSTRINLRPEALECRRMMAADLLCHAGDAASSGQPSTIEDRATALFTKLDANQSGLLEPAEVTGKLAKKLAGADTDQDSNISPTELTDFLKNALANHGPGDGPRGHHGQPKTPEELAASILGKFDTDGSGMLETSEVTGKLAEKLKGADTNNDGAISSDELITLLKTKQAEHQQEHTPLTAAQIADKIFSKFDTNTDGSLNPTDDKIADKPWTRLAKADADGNGSVTLDEMTTFIQSKMNSSTPSTTTSSMTSHMAARPHGHGRRG